MRAIFAIIVGVVAGFAILILIGVIGVGATFSLPAGIDPYDSRQVVALLETMPAAPKFGLLASLFGGTLGGAAIAKLIAGRTWPAWTVTILIALYVVLSILSLPLTGLEQTLAIAAPVAGGLIGNHLAQSRRGAAAADEKAAASTEI